MTFVAALVAAPLAWAQPVPAPPAPGPAPASPPVTATQPAPEAAPAAAAPPAGDPLSRAGSLLETRVEEIRRGNRVTEVRVTGADGEPRYTMENRVGRPPSQFEATGAGLSTPNFLHIEF